MAEKEHTERKIKLHGRIVLQMNVHAITGMHIGGAATGLEIGGVDSPVIRDPLTQHPYIPGSSVRGKMRSLTERIEGRVQNFKIGKDVFIHMLQQEELTEEQYHIEFLKNETCSIFGVTGDTPVPHPTALVVRDARLSQDSVKQLQKAKTDLPFTEVKWEATIDRVTSAATPRQIERVPAGSVFEGLELVYSIYGPSNLTHLPVLLRAVTLVEEDYLGGLGARGSGKVKFKLTDVYARVGCAYQRKSFLLKNDDKGMDANRDGLVTWAQEIFADLLA